MTINYMGTFKADITLDDNLTYHDMNDHYHSLQDYIDKATYLMKVYGFIKARIVDCENGSVLVEMESDCNDCGGPAWYDDGDTYGYE